jgi:signal transduction histidine kinase
VTALIDLILRGEERILAEFLSRAEANGYFRFAAHDADGWRPTVRGFSGSLVQSLRNSPDPAELTAGDVGRDDGLSAFGVVEARKRRLEGMPLGIFLGILKLLRLSYMERVCCAALPPEEEGRCRLRVERFFDRNEIASCVAWTMESGFERVEEMVRTHDEALADLRRNREEWAQQERMASIGQLAAGVTHEIVHPIGFIHSNLVAMGKHLARLTGFLAAQSECIAAGAPASMAEALRQKRAQLKLDYILQDVDDLIRESLEGMDRVRSIVSDLKGFSRPDEGGFRQEDVNGCVRRAVLLAGNELSGRATLRIELGEVPPTRCNPRQIDLVFLNLLVNAADAIGRRGAVTVRSWAEDGFLRFSVSDTGHGIPKENLDRIFDPFFTTREGGGWAGLGLSIASDIVKRHNGSITVRSSPEKGSTFTVLLPIVQEA